MLSIPHLNGDWSRQTLSSLQGAMSSAAFVGPTAAAPGGPLPLNLPSLPSGRTPALRQTSSTLSVCHPLLEMLAAVIMPCSFLSSPHLAL